MVRGVPGGFAGFTQASESVLDYLRSVVPMGFWSVTRYDGSRQVHLTLRDDRYGFRAGQSFDWEDTLCQHSVSGAAPHVAPDTAAVPLYAESPAVQELPVAAYVGIPIVRPDGTLFGTLCGLDPEVRGEELAAHEPLLELLSSLLAAILEGDLERIEAARQLERAELLAETDPLTALNNRRGWEQFIDREEDRYRRYGEPAAVVAVDLDGLKVVNDRDGHPAGDDLLVLAADTLRTVVRSTDVAARLGGDEFGVIATHTNHHQAATLVERIRQAFADAGIPASVGSAVFAIDTGFRGAWAQADAEMYAEKRRRRGAGVGAGPSAAGSGAS